MARGTYGQRTHAANQKKASGPRWDHLELGPIILLSVGEPVLGDWAVERLVRAAHARDPHTEITTVDASLYTAGMLPMLASPSLFGESRMILVQAAEKMNDAFLADALQYLEGPESDVVVVIRHNGGTRGKKLLDTIDSKGFPHTHIAALGNGTEKADLIRQVVRESGRNISPDAVHNLVDALGNDVAELVAATRQLVTDVEGDITGDAVRTYYAGRTEATGFAVADAVVAGNTGRAIALARHAMATGTGPVPIVAAIALKLRSMALALALRGNVDPKEVRLAPWQIERARRDLTNWNGEALAHAILAVARADAEVKGASRDPQFAVERAIIRIGAARRISM